MSKREHYWWGVLIGCNIGSVVMLVTLYLAGVLNGCG